MAKYLNLSGLQTLWTKAKNTFSQKSHNHDASDINAGTLPIARGGTGATTWQNANEAILGGTAEEANDFGDDSQIICRYVNATSNKQRTYYRKTSRIWNYIKSKLGISSAVGSTTNPVYVDAKGQLKAVGGTMLKQGSLIDTHSEGFRTMWIDGTNELFAFYDRGGTCTAYEYDLEWNSSSPAPAGTFSPTDLSSHKTTASVANISANVFNSLTGYNQSTVYSGTKYAVYDLKLPASFAYGTSFYWSFGASTWKPHYFEVLVWKDNATQYPNGYMSKYRSTSVDACGAVSVSVGETEGNSFTHIRIVMDKYTRLAAFGVVNYSSTGLATNYMSRTVDRSLYRSISVAKNNTYNLGSSSYKWANVYATNFNGALKGNADTATKATNDSDGNKINDTYRKKNAIAIANSTNLNTLTTDTTGGIAWYICKTSGTASSLTNKPSSVNNEFLLEVRHTNDPDYVSQRIYSAVNGDWYRKCNGGTWSEWKRAYATTTDVLSDTSEQQISSKAVKSALDAKQDDISNLIPTAASASNPLCDKAYADAIGERLEARYLGCNANGDPFATHAALTSATKFYYQGAEATPDTNDITTVIADEDHKNTSNVAGTTRYRYGGVDASGKPVWAFEYVINNTGLSQAQLLAVNSGITATKVGNYDSHIADTTKHITAAERTAWNGKQNALTQGTNITISGNTISATDTTYSEPTDTILQDIVDALTLT